VKTLVGGKVPEAAGEGVVRALFGLVGLLVLHQQSGRWMNKPGTLPAPPWARIRRRNNISLYHADFLRRFVERMDLAYAAADVAVCRAGAVTCSELLATGTPSVLVSTDALPSPHLPKPLQADSRIGLLCLHLTAGF